jgi:mRNA-degrading endonuclease RelE of RelBE toxin-antitoxin system
MRLEISRAFVKDTEPLPQKTKLVILELIKQLQSVKSPFDIHDCEKLKGSTDLFRIRRGVYRVTFQYDGVTVTLKRVLPRGQVYKKNNL